MSALARPERSTWWARTNLPLSYEKRKPLGFSCESKHHGEEGVDAALVTRFLVGGLASASCVLQLKTLPSWIGIANKGKAYEFGGIGSLKG